MCRCYKINSLGLSFCHCSWVTRSSSNGLPAAANSSRVISPRPLELKYVNLYLAAGIADFYLNTRKCSIKILLKIACTESYTLSVQRAVFYKEEYGVEIKNSANLTPYQQDVRNQYKNNLFNFLTTKKANDKILVCKY